MQFLITIALCLALILGIGSQKEDPPAIQTETVSVQEAEAAAGSDAAAETEEAASLVPEYYRYDATEFNADCERLAASRDADEVVVLYDKLHAEYLDIFTLTTVAYIRYCDNVNDEYWTEENSWSAVLCSDAFDRLCAACRSVMDGPCADALRAHVGDDAADGFAEYEAAGAELASLFEREQELVSEYYTAVDGVGELAAEVQGQTWTVGEWKSGAGLELYYSDYDSYVEIASALQGAMNDTFGTIYLELVEVRKEIAESCGYDDYIEYAYEYIYSRDYSREEAESFCEQVRSLVSERYYDEVYSDPRSYGSAAIGMDTDELLSTIGSYAGQVDSAVADVLGFMLENGLYDIEPGGGGRMEGACVTELPASGAAFLFATTYGNSLDLMTICHELGHFTHRTRVHNPNLPWYGADYDLLEVHSNGLEVLFTQFYDDIYGDIAQDMKYAELGNQLAGVIDGCIYDEFQRRVYTAEELTSDDLSLIYGEICAAYGEYDEAQMDTGWIYVPHNFDSPFYYISYAASSLAALQLWDESREDFDGAVADWLALVNADPYEGGYMEALADCGLNSFADEGTVADVCLSVMDYLTTLE